MIRIRLSHALLQQDIPDSKLQQILHTQLQFKMDSLHCSMDDQKAQKSPIIAICIDNQCKASYRTLCSICLQKYHNECQAELILNKEQLYEQLQDKYNHNQEENLLDKFQALKSQINVILDKVEQAYGIEPIIQNIKRIQNEPLTEELWQQGYSLLSGESASLEIKRQKRILQWIDKIKQLLLEIEDGQQKLQTYKNQKHVIPYKWNHIDKGQIIIDNLPRVTYMDQSLDGQYLACGGHDGNVRIYDFDTSKATDLIGHKETITSIKFSMDGQFVASGSENGTIRVWHIPTQKQVGQLEGHPDKVNSLGYSPDGRNIVSGSRDGVRIWSCETYKQDGNTLVTDCQSMCVEYSPDGKQIISGTSDGHLIIWNSVTRQQLKKIAGHTGVVCSVHYALDSLFIVSVCCYRIMIHDSQTGLEISKLPDEDKAYTRSVAFSPDFQYMLIVRHVGQQHQTVRDYIQLQSVLTGKKVIVKYVENSDLTCAQFTRDGRFILYLINDTTLLMVPFATVAQKL